MKNEILPEQTVPSESSGSVLQLELPSIGLGIQRTSGTYLALLLHLEADQAASVLVEAAKDVGITLEQITEIWNDKMCHKCGMATRFHHPITGECQ